MEKESTENRAESDPIDGRMVLAKQLLNSSVALHVFTSSLPTEFPIFGKL